MSFIGALEGTPALAKASADWLSLSLKLSLATNSPPDCLLNTATLSGSSPNDINKKDILSDVFYWCARRDSNP